MAVALAMIDPAQMGVVEHHHDRDTLLDRREQPVQRDPEAAASQ
jgi:hypothetical protein